MKDVLNIIIIFSLVLLLIIISSFLIGTFYGVPTGNIAIIPIHDEIFPITSIFQGVQTSDSIISLIDSAEENPNVEAIILSINSPGGTVVSSKEVSKRVMNASKPVISWIRDLGTSGAYLIASSSDYIISDELSMVGSIGSMISYLEWSETLSDYGVQYVSITSGELKDMGSMYRNLTQKEESMFQKWVNESAEYFINHVITTRGLNNETIINIISDGRVMSGTEAYNYGLVDELGGKKEVINYLNSINITTLNFENYKSNSFFTELSNFAGYKSVITSPTYD